MSRTVSPSAKRAYGLGRVCRTWGLSRATIWRHGRAANLPKAPRRRPGPQGPMRDDALASEIRALLATSPFHGEGYRKVWARLRVASIRTSPRRVLRVMRENALLSYQRVGAARGPRAHDGTITTEKVDEMWGTDLTGVMTGEGTAAVFVAVDHCSAECVGIHASARATRHEALEPIRQAVRGAFGAIGQSVAAGLSIRHDHGSQYMSGDFQKELRFLGATSSPAFVRAPEGNGCGPSASSGRSRRTCSGSGGSRPSKTCGKPSSNFSEPTTRNGSSSATDTAHQRRSDASRPQSCRRPLNPRSLSQKCRPVQSSAPGFAGTPRTA